MQLTLKKINILFHHTFLWLWLGVFLPVNSYAVEKITVMALFNNKAMIKIDNKQLMLKAGETSPEGIKLISANSREAILEYNGVQKTYKLGSEISANFKGPAEGITVTVAPDLNGMYEVNGAINGFQVKFLVDTGASLISMNRSDAQRIGIDYKMTGIEGITETASGHTGIYVVNLDTVSVGDITLNDVQAAVHDDNFPTTILLGNSFLSRINMTREDKILQLKK